MAECGTLTFADPEGYGAEFSDARVNLTITGAGDFKAQLTRIKLKYLEIYRLCESLPRIAYISLPIEHDFVSFSDRATSLMFDGVSLRSEDVILHSRGERLHQRTCGECKWGLISISPKQLANFSKALTGGTIVSHHAARILRPLRTDALRLRRLFRQACDLVDSKKKILEHPEVGRALEQEMLHAIIHCLTAEETDDNTKKRQRHAGIMARFEEALSECSVERLTMPAICAEIGVPERTLRKCCNEFLGVSPTRYLLLQRLNKARSALRRADPSIASVAEVARNHQFHELGRFAVKYRATFGESPSITLQRGPQTQSIGRSCIAVPGRPGRSLPD
jgi:AraC-like DNA-binding protein